MPSNDLPPPVAEQVLSEFDLKQLRANPLDIAEAVGTKPCGPGNPGEIIVCGRSRSYYRPRPLPGSLMTQGDPIRAGVKLGDKTRIDVHSEAATLAGGAQSNRMMFTLGQKF